MESHHSTSFELGILREQGGKESPCLDAYLGVEVLQNQLRVVISGESVMVDILSQRNASQSEHRHSPIQSPNNHLPLSNVSDNEDMRVVHVLGVGVHFGQLVLLSRVVVATGEHDHEFLNKVVESFGWLIGGRKHQLDWFLLAEQGFELVHLMFWVLFNEMGLSGGLFILDGGWLLPLIGRQGLPALPGLGLYILQGDLPLFPHLQPLLLIFDVRCLDSNGVVELFLGPRSVHEPLSVLLPLILGLLTHLLIVIMNAHLVNLVRYTQWRHYKVHQFISQMGDPQAFVFGTFGCLFFNSPKGTLDHLMISDEYWTMRLTGLCHTPEYRLLSSYWGGKDKDKFGTHWPKANWIDHYKTDTSRILNNYLQILNSFPNDLSLDRTVSYPDTKGETQHKIVRNIFTHVVNHHTHHLGQVSAAYREFSRKDDFPSLTSQTIKLDRLIIIMIRSLLLVLIVTAVLCDLSKQKGTHRITFDISIHGKPSGQVELDLFGDVVPKTVKNFVQICNGATEGGQKLSFDGSGFHRIIPSFMIQGGDFTRHDGTGGHSIYGRKFDDENFSLQHEPYCIAMANSGADTNGSQFYISTAETSWLDGKHVVFGRVVKGKDVIQNIERQGSPSGTPKQKVQITKCSATAL